MPGFFVSLCDKGNLNNSDEISGSILHTYYTDYFKTVFKSLNDNVGSSFLENDSYLIYIYGDILNHQEKDFIELIDNYDSKNMRAILSELNGYFSIMIFEKKKDNLIIISDRYGLKPLYVWINDSKLLTISSELKSILINADFDSEIDFDAVNSYIKNGHMLGGGTWFKEVSRFPPASIMNINLKDNSFHIKNYWSWSKIKKNDNISFDDAVEQLGILYKKSIKKTLSNVKGNKLAITLSGGLDSRVLLAEAKKQFSGEIETFTFGMHGCDDAILAKKVSDVAGVKNNFKEINEDNWFVDRENGVWITDGLFNIVHMHALSSVSDVKSFSSYLLNGFLGDVIIGGSYLDENYLNKKPKKSSSLINLKYHGFCKLTGYEDEYFNFNCVDSIFIANRGVRFISAGSDLLENNIHNMKPFMDNDLIEFLYSLPDEYRFNSRIYNAMLLKNYPEYFLDIPWQNTGKVISVDWSAKKNSIKSKIKSKIINNNYLLPIARRIYGLFSKKNSYVSYSDWLRSDAFISYLNIQFNSPISFNGKTYYSSSYLKEQVEKFISDKSMKPEEIGGYLTMSLYFQMINDKKGKL